MAVRDLAPKVAHVLPPVFILGIIGTVESVYISLHLLPLLQTGVPEDARDHGVRNLGIFQTVVSQSIALMLLICYARATLASPGVVPPHSQWLLDTPEATKAVATREFKLSGKRRHCKWCDKYKPDRTHHCRVCETCVLRMDHHCPWIMNCVGFRNHKYFMLLVLYTVLDCFFIMVTMASTVSKSCYEETASSTRFQLVLGMTLSVVMGITLATFMSFHVWLMLRGMTTIEFCEKTVTQNAGVMHKTGANYDRGFRNNIEAVLGSNPLLWLLPVNLPEGDGQSWNIAPEPSRPDPEWTGTERSEQLADR